MWQHRSHRQVRGKGSQEVLEVLSWIVECRQNAI